MHLGSAGCSTCIIYGGTPGNTVDTPRGQEYRSHAVFRNNAAASRPAVGETDCMILGRIMRRDRSAWRVREVHRRGAGVYMRV